LLSKEEARRIAVNIAKLPDLLRRRPATLFDPLSESPRVHAGRGGGQRNADHAIVD
jgi:hypothetical protein